MSKNEVLWKTKILMQQSLSRGDPSPKLSKMLEVLIEHFSMFHGILLLYGSWLVWHSCLSLACVRVNSISLSLSSLSLSWYAISIVFNCKADTVWTYCGQQFKIKVSVVFDQLEVLYIPSSSSGCDNLHP